MSDSKPVVIKHFSVQVNLPVLENGQYPRVIIPNTVEANDAEDAIKKMKAYLTDLGVCSTDIVSVTPVGAYILR